MKYDQSDEAAFNALHDYGMDLIREFESAEDATRDSRVLAERDRDYYDEKQLTAEEMAELKARGQPPVVFNRIKRKINAMTGIEKQSRKDPRAFPRNPSDEDSARAATDALRFVCDQCDWDSERSLAAFHLAVEGTCAVFVGFGAGKDGTDPRVKNIPWDRLYYDPHSSKHDFADAKFLGIVTWMDLKDAKAAFPNDHDKLVSMYLSGAQTETYDDKPKHALWIDYKRQRVRICEHYHQVNGEWRLCYFTAAGVLGKPEPSPYTDEHGRPECPIKAVSLYVDRDNNRYGEVRGMISQQDEVNKRRSKALSHISQQKYRIDPDAGVDAATAKKILSRPDGVILAKAGEVEAIDSGAIASVNLQLLSEAKAEIDLTGPNAALGGKNEQALSGKAIQAQQAGGMTELATYFDRIRQLSLMSYRSLWARIKQSWTGERWLRITENETDVRFVGINRQVTAIEMVAEKYGITKKTLPQADPQLVSELEVMAQYPEANQVMKIENNVMELDVDIVLDEGVDAPTVRAEQFETIVKMLPTLGPIAQSPEVIKMIIEASSLRDKDKLLKLFEGQGQADPQVQMQAQMEQERQKLQMMGEIEIEKAKIKAMAEIEGLRIKARYMDEVRQGLPPSGANEMPPPGYGRFDQAAAVSGV